LQGLLGQLVQRLELSDDEALAIFRVDPLSAITDELEHRPEVSILDHMTREAADQLTQPVLARWLRAGPPAMRPLDLLLDARFAEFEDALGRRMALLG
jgi:hypothetical protein